MQKPYVYPDWKDIGVLGFDFRRGLGIFFFTTASRLALGPTQLSLQWVPGALSLGVKRPEREADYSPPSSAEVKNAWSYTSVPQYASMTWCSAKKAQGQFYIYGWNTETIRISWLEGQIFSFPLTRNMRIIILAVDPSTSDQLYVPIPINTITKVHSKLNPQGPSP
jgi:hypothetical protein